jgi:hypothetical protein
MMAVSRGRGLLIGGASARAVGTWRWRLTGVVALSIGAGLGPVVADAQQTTQPRPTTGAQAASLQSTPAEQPAQARETRPPDHGTPLEGRWKVDLELNPKSIAGPTALQTTGEIAFGSDSWWGTADRFGRQAVNLIPFFGRSFSPPSNVTPFTPADTSFLTEVSGALVGDTLVVDFIPRLDHLGVSLRGRFYGDSARGEWYRRGSNGSGTFVLHRVSRVPVEVAAIPTLPKAAETVAAAPVEAPKKGAKGKKVAAKPANKNAEKAVTKGATKDSTTTVAKAAVKDTTTSVAKVAAKDTTKVAAKVAAKDTTKVAAKVAAKDTTKVAAKAAAKDTTKVAAKVAAKDTTTVVAKSAAKDTTTVVAKSAAKDTTNVARAALTKPAPSPATATSAPASGAAAAATPPRVPTRMATRQSPADPAATGALRVRMFDNASKQWFVTQYQIHLPDGTWMWGNLRSGLGPDGWGPVVPRRPGKYEIAVENFVCGDKYWFFAKKLVKPVVVQAGDTADVTIEVDLAAEPAKATIDNKAGARCTAGPGTPK